MTTESAMRNRRDQGFSLTELLIVIIIMIILAGFTVLALGSKEVYDVDERAYVVLDFLKEARQRAITQREVMRIEINRNESKITLINENSASTTNDDEEIRSEVFPPREKVLYDKAPDNIDNAPTEVTPVPTLDYKLSVHPLSTPDMVGTLRFMPNGTVVDAGSDALGNNAVVKGATIYFWSPQTDSSGADTDNGQIIRAITVLGSSGNTNYLRCPLTGPRCPNWK